MKKALPLLLTAILAACGGDNDDTAVAASQPATPASANPAPSGAPVPTPDTTTPTTTPASTVTAAESTFLSEAVQSGTAIVQQAQAALQRSGNEDVRRFAQLLIDNHTQLNTSLAQLAQANSVTLPVSATSAGTAGASGSTGATGTTAGTPNTTTGNSTTTTGATPSANPTGTTSNEELDRLYLQQSLQQQRQYVTRFNEQVNGATNAQIKGFALNALPLLQLQLLTAKELGASIDPAAYLVGSYEDGLGEISLANLALERSQNEAVRAYAQMMIAHHSELNQQIAAVAQAKNVALPQAATLPVEHAVPRDNLAQLSGADFNKAYMSQNVVVHLGDVGATQAQSTSGTDTEVRNLATASLPRLQTHLQEATGLYASLQPSFLAAAFQSNVNEILLATLATPQRATNEAVRRYAQHMVEDHGKQNTAVAQLASQENVVLPKVLPAEGVIAYRTLLPKTGDDFNRSYTAENVRLHEVAVALFTDRSANEPDPEQKAFATANLPVLRAHLQEATQLNAGLPPAATTPSGTTDPAANATATTPAANTSTPAAGATTPPAGSSTPSADASTPAAGSATPPPAESSTPAAGATIPPAGSSTPAAGSTTPPADPSAPAVGATTPPAGLTTPAAGATTPPAESSTPAAGATTPPVSSTTPAADTTTPPAGSSTPAAGATTPATGPSTPAAGSTIPAAGSSTPTASTPLAGTATPTPDATTPAAGTTTPTPGAAAPVAGT